MTRLPQTSEGLHGKTMGKPQPLVKRTSTGAGGVPNQDELPNTPEANTPAPENTSEATGPMDLGQARPTTQSTSQSILEGLPETVSTSTLVNQSRGYGDGGF